jgi:hypothetical protein
MGRLLQKDSMEDTDLQTQQNVARQHVESDLGSKQCRPNAEQCCVLAASTLAVSQMLISTVSLKRAYRLSHAAATLPTPTLPMLLRPGQQGWM